MIDYMTQGKANCGLHAMREVTGMDDELVIDVAIKAGWKDGFGMGYQSFLRACSALRIEWTTEKCWVTIGGVKKGQPTVAQFAAKYKGTWAVCIEGHVLVVRDGQVIDNQGRKNLRKRVVRANKAYTTCFGKRVAA